MTSCKRSVNRSRWLRPLAVCLVGAAIMLTSACSIELPDLSGPTGPFLLKGTFVQVERFGQTPCFAWEGDNGVLYHLFQDVDLDSADFDAATTVGVRSRLLIQRRADLQVTCELGPIVEVLEVREIIGGA